MTTGRARVTGKAALKATASFVAQPSSLIFLLPSTVTGSPGQLVSVYVLGSRSTWSTATRWTIMPKGASLGGSAFAVGSPTAAAWAIILGPGIGTITLTDPTGGSAILTVKKG